MSFKTFCKKIFNSNSEVAAEKTPSQGLILLTRENEIQTVKELLEKGADPDTRDQDGNTALMVAAIHGRPEIARLLIENGADMNMKDNHGMTAILLATRYEKPEVVHILLDNKACTDGLINEQRISQIEKTLRELQKATPAAKAPASPH